MLQAEHKVKVVCRVRPFLEAERPDDSVKDVEFNFDACYGPGETQEAIYQNDVEPLTHTIQGTEKDPGIIPRALRHIFGRQNHDPLDYDIRISYYEIYKEAVYDLLKPGEPPIALPIREDAYRKVFVAGLSERKITSLEQFNTIYQRACRNRRTASTKLNNHSSRSHAILTVRVQWTDEEKAWCGRVHLIDLAGSEDNRRSAINRSLFVLGQVVEALNSSSLRIPYRDSKMTRILQDSLGGESMGMMIVNVAPGEEFLQETHNTLSFATKSRKVVNKPVAHEVIEPRWTVVDRLQHHRGLGRPVRPGMVVAAASGAKRRWSDESDAFGKQQTTKHRRLKHNQEIMERVMRIEKQLQKPTLDSDQVMDLFTPATKLKTSRGWLKYARDLEHNGELEKALVHYEEALRYAPELNKLDAHIAKLKTKIRRERRRSSIASHGSANMRIADRKAIQEPPTPDDRNDEDFVPNSDASDAEEIEEAKLLSEMTMYGSTRSLSRQQKAGDDSGQCNSPADAAVDLSVDKNSHPGSKRKPSSSTSAEEEPLALDSFNSICIASAMQMINSGDVKKIMKLQGIGKRRAEQIQASILAEGPVVNIADLRDRLHFKNKIIVGILSTFA
ncbi:kinesin-domain-containing protein [Linderina pennispora]|uniref:Kinesin-like protein n=1 Tax=Linderina pennispora TaxID=61395 RepID=A0A1Y1WG03_9FUNG|nr:kinesin-domain-containing protein [Linderina pennispora]ORX72417.1 kinesin-domain-containing protein [Linderina pennispora]